MIRKLNGKNPKIAPSAFVSEAAYVIGDVEIGDNSSIWPGAIIRGDFGKIKIGNNTSLEDNCVVHGATDIIIGNNVIIGHGAVIHCHSIGNSVLVGNNATILDGARIGNFCIIGAASLVKPEAIIPDKSLALGSPARIRSRISPSQQLDITEGSELYSRLAQEYKKQGYCS